MEQLWGDCGKQVAWAFNRNAETGTRHHIVFEVVSVDHTMGNVLLFPCGSRARIMQGFPMLANDTVSLTVMFAKLVDALAMPSFIVDDESTVLQHPRIQKTDIRSVVEICCGIGVGTTGMAFAGMKTVAACDVNHRMLEVFQHWRNGIPTVCGDIDNPQTVIDLWKAHPRCSAMMVGFACQPYSKGGQQNGVNDNRSTTLLAALRAAFWMRCHVIILECVPSAATNRHVRMVVESYRDQCIFHLAEVILKQELCWVSRRERWWAVLTAAIVGRIGLMPLPDLTYPAVVRHVLPHGIDMSDEDLKQLILSPSEHEKLLQHVADVKQMSMPLNGKAPTALHSWGSQFVACPCGCRAHGFANSTLASKGVYGLVLEAPGVTYIHGIPHDALRHPHPIEVAILNAVEFPTSWNVELRLALAGLGQQACPIHALWITSQVLAHLDRLQFGSTSVDCNALLDLHREKIVMLAKSIMRPQIALEEQRIEDVPIPLDQTESLPNRACCAFNHVGGPNEVTVVDSHTLARVVIVVESSTQVRHLVEAEEQCNPGCSILSVHDCLDARMLSSNDPIAGLCVWIVRGAEFPEVDMEPDVASPEGFVADAITPTVPFSLDAETVSSTEPVVWDMGLDELPIISDPYQLVEPDVDMQSLAQPVDPLCALGSSQLQAMLPPVVMNLSMKTALCSSTMVAEARVHILQNQEGLWADDEIRWHVDQMLTQSHRVGWFQIDPLILAVCVKQNSIRLLTQWFASLSGMPSAFVGAVFLDGHWMPFMWTWTPDLLTAHSWDVSRAHHPGLSLLHDALAKLVGAKSFSVRTLLRDFAKTELCGPCAVRYLDNCIRGKMLPTQFHEVEYLHSVGRRMFAEMLMSHDQVPRPWIFGAGLDSKAMVRLQDLLQQHGVPLNQLETRTNLILSSLDHHQLQQGLTGSNPWRAIKALANQKKPVVQLVLPAELEAVVSERASKGKVQGRKKKTLVQGAQPMKPAELDPAMLALHDGAFVRDDNTPLTHLQVSSIGPFAEGVVLASFSQVEGHLKAGIPITALALGLVVLNVEEKQMTTSLSWSQIRAVVRCKANNEPMIIPAYLVQLGGKPVRQAALSTFTEVPQVDAACIKLSIYRDEAVSDWKEIIASPFRYLMHHLSPLNACSNNSCKCDRWHQGEEPVSEPVLDVWRRQWVNMSFHAVAPDQADAFVVNVRCVASVFSALMHLSGNAGIYAEPRTMDAKAPMLDYQVLWMPRIEKGELVRLKQVNPLILGIARLGSRMGLRVRNADAAAVAKVVKPGTVVLAAGLRQSYEMGPMPFGMDRLTVTKLCTNWGWQARPMYPSRTLEGEIGTMWLLQAVVDPPQPVIAYKGGEIIITKLPQKSTAESSGQQNRVIGSSATVALCSVQPAKTSPQVDMVFKNDPWAASLTKSSLGVSSSTDAMIGLQQVEKRIEESVLSKLQPKGEGGDCEMLGSSSIQAATDSRLDALESQLNMLQGNQQSLSKQVDDNARRADAQLHQLQVQVGSQLEVHSTNMEELFKSQMQQIETLLMSKKARTE